ncbi:pancreatic triacylglycerol lipase-like [Arctopsyche grandis]|uniref:pancreatic triacylglycerol lipase-like n=1 Tax=Arctopsyche grandis TaxID=121162 RepID=UPI00406D960B
MKLLSFIFVVFLSVTSISAGTKSLFSNEYEEGQRYFLYGGEDGKIILVDLFEEEPELRYDAENSVKFILHTRLGSEDLQYGDDAALKASRFNNKKPVKIIIHGWNNNGGSEVNTLITDAFLKSDDLNVIVVNWKKGANSLYTSSAKNVVKVGAFVGKLIDWLVDNGTPLKSFHLIGHSLGGHAVGIAGRSVTKGTVPYITAMDPANPLWGSKSERVRPSDADYVEVIHTDSGSLGLKEPVGDIDFYPNKGSSQPGCLIDVSCSHSRSYEFFADSIDHKGFMADQCTDYKEMSKGKCAKLSQMHMGGSSPKNAVGIFYLETNKKKPFYKS